MEIGKIVKIVKVQPEPFPAPLGPAPKEPAVPQAPTLEPANT